MYSPSAKVPKQTKLRWMLVLSAAIIVAASLACSTPAPPPTPSLLPATPTLAPAPSATPEPTATPAPTNTSAPDGLPTPDAAATPMALFQYSGAVGLLRSGLYEEAVPEYSIVIRMLPDFALAYYGRGVAYMRQERPAYSLALEDLNSAIELDPGMANAYRERAEWHVRQGDLESAKADLETAIPLYDQQRQGNDLLAALIMQQQLAEGQISGFGESESESTPVPAP